MSAMPFPRSFSLLTPLLWVAAMFLLLLAMRSVLQNRSPRRGLDRETIERGRPRPSLIQRWSVNRGRIRFRLLRFSQRQMPEIAPKPAPSVPANAPADPLKKPTQPRFRPTPVRRDQRAAVAQRTERSRAATRREPAPRFRRQLRSRPVPRESVLWPRSWCGSRASLLLRTANWTGD